MIAREGEKKGREESVKRSKEQKRVEERNKRMGQRWRVEKKEGGRAIGRYADETRETSKGNSRSGARPRPRVPGQGGKRTKSRVGGH